MSEIAVSSISWIHKPRSLFSIAVVLFALCVMPPAALPQDPANPPGMTVGGFGTLTIRVMSFTGTPVPPATVTLLADMGEMTGINPVTRLDGGDYTYFFSTLGPGRYAVVVNAAGFQASRQTVELTPESLAEELVFMLKPVGADGKPLEIPPSAVLTPKSQKEMQNAMKDLQLKKFDSAQKHLLVAFQSSPGNAQINYLLGMTYVWMDQADKGKPYLEKAVALNPKHLESLLALGNLRCREGDFAGGTTLLESAIVLAPTAWQPHQTLAYAYLQQREFAKARDNADRAFELGKEKATGAQLLQAQALLGMGDKPQATTVLTSYLQTHPKDAYAAKLLDWVTKPQRSVETSLSVTPPKGPMSAKEAAPVEDMVAPPATRDTWGPPDVDASVPTTVGTRPCILPKVLAGAGKRAEEMVAHIEQFSAMEKYESVEIRGNGQLSEPTTAVFNYMVFIQHINDNSLGVDEMREQNKATASLPGKLQDMGSSGVFLVFHPQYRDDFEMKCEGLGQWNGQATWLVHFQQRSDKLPRLREFISDQKGYPMRLRGRAWISAESSQLVHLESDLVQPLPEVRLRREHMTVDYQLVPFPKHKVEIWLPQQVDLYVDFRGHFYHHLHTFSDFQLIAVEVEHKVGKPKT
jgi:tetratricopeptide (TPR) repeat protein